ncbi:hypothetical protein AVEN_123151-1 [Araneus ventricosus]|uniref:Uncharacterized protein n=1 Tax=Araneus ventricosus TaxID=182803 RepID=A0A4Y2T5X2_ARAVE|nr:hypothetical protein AVEN_123151-1 [Araneus ventricosus]
MKYISTGKRWQKRHQLSSKEIVLGVGTPQREYHGYEPIQSYRHYQIDRIHHGEDELGGYSEETDEQVSDGKIEKQIWMRRSFRQPGRQMLKMTATFPKRDVTIVIVRIPILRVRV